MVRYRSIDRSLAKNRFKVEVPENQKNVKVEEPEPEVNVEEPFDPEQEQGEADEREPTDVKEESPAQGKEQVNNAERNDVEHSKVQKEAMKVEARQD